MNTWLAFWDSDHSIYVSERHKTAHANLVLRDISAILPDPHSRLLDFGCGEARYAQALAARCGELVLCEAAGQVRAALAQRLSSGAGCRVISDDELSQEKPGSFDFIVVNSVLQYIERVELAALLEQWRDLLAPHGQLILADIVRPETGAARDALSLLRFAWYEGFLIDAVVGLGRMAVSDYRRVRSELGLQTYRPQDLNMMLNACGLHGRQLTRNFGHNQSRFTILAQRA